MLTAGLLVVACLGGIRVGKNSRDLRVPVCPQRLKEIRMGVTYVTPIMLS